MPDPTPHRLFAMLFAKLYLMYVNKAQRKGRTQAEVDRLIAWLTGYDAAALARQLERGVDVQTFFAEAPAPNAARVLVTGVVCGVRVEDVADPLMQEIRRLDKMVVELAKGRAMEKILPQ